MSSLETNKVFAAALIAGITFVGSGLVGSALLKPKPLAQTAIKIDLPEAAGAVAAAPEQPIAVLLASADAGRGEAGVRAQGCVACHNFNDGGKAGVGPNLYGVVGGPHGHQEGFAYSAVLKGKAGPWTLDEMNEWLLKPAAYAPGTKMTYAGLADAKKRADIIMYLRSLSATPVALPAAPAPSTTAEAAPAARGPGPAAPVAPASIETRLASADATAGQADTMKLGCIACHSYNEGGKNGVGPNMWGVVGAPVAARADGYTYSAALKAKGGNWSYDEMDKWLTAPMKYVPGTKMTYAGVPDPKTRADVIAYLRTLSGSPEPLPAAK